jgi:trehalose-6-phosphatase
MSPFSKKSRSQLSQEFAEIFQVTQEEYRDLLADLRNDDIDVVIFTARAEGFFDRLVKLKRIRLQLSHEREMLRLSEDDEVI